MCGIFGTWQLDGRPLDLLRFRRATDAMRHRGPDDEGYLLVNTQTGRTVSCAGENTDPRLGLSPLESFADDQFDLALGFRRLAILDLSPAGHQPMSRADGRLWIVLNGEIYNHEELRGQLIEQGHDFRSRTDTEVALAAYEEWGPDCLLHFNGMWALAVWNGKENALLLARDRLGIKPLYYARDNAGITFASEIKALVQSGTVRFEPNEEAIYRYLVAGWLPSPREGSTFFKHIHSVPPGTSLTVRPEGLTTRRFWRLDLEAQPGATRRDANTIHEFRSLFTDAVHLELRTDVPIGSCLSGGVDSSSIVCTISQLMASDPLSKSQLGDRQKTFSAVYGAVAPYDESEHIEKVTEAAGCEAHFSIPTFERLRQEAERLVWQQDEPVLSSSVFAQWCVMNGAQTSGVKVMLDGQGADELLAGYRPYSVFLADLLRQGRVARALHEARAVEQRTGVPTWSPLFGALRHLLPGRLMDAVRRQWYAHEQDWSVLNRDFVTKFDHATIADWQASSEYHGLRRHLRYLLEESSLPHLLRYEDRNSMAFGVEARVPFLDHGLVEFSLHQDTSMLLRDGWTKWMLRKAMEGTVPDSVVWRRDKVGFETPETAWLLRWMKTEPDFFRPDSFSSEYLDVKTASNKIASWARNDGRAPHLPLWRWINLELWLKSFRDAALHAQECTR
jgi:asparagine synthase (glutamine-hydrolysing)